MLKIANNSVLCGQMCENMSTATGLCSRSCSKSMVLRILEASWASCRHPRGTFWGTSWGSSFGRVPSGLASSFTQLHPTRSAWVGGYEVVSTAGGHL